MPCMQANCTKHRQLLSWGSNRPPLENMSDTYRYSTKCSFQFKPINLINLRAKHSTGKHLSSSFLAHFLFLVGLGTFSYALYASKLHKTQAADKKWQSLCDYHAIIFIIVEVLKTLRSNQFSHWLKTPKQWSHCTATTKWLYEVVCHLIFLAKGQWKQPSFA